MLSPVFGTPLPERLGDIGYSRYYRTNDLKSVIRKQNGPALWFQMQWRRLRREEKLGKLLIEKRREAEL
jgi:hypothetical protein